MSAPQVKLSFSYDQPYKDRKRLNSSIDSINFVRTLFDNNTIEHVEEFHLVMLDNCLGVIGYTLVSRGGIDACVVDIRIVMQYAILSNSTRIIIAHNHPSGKVQPSKADSDVTEKLTAALKIFGIGLLDHIIITRDDAYSFANEGKL